MTRALCCLHSFQMRVELQAVPREASLAPGPALAHLGRLSPETLDGAEEAESPPPGVPLASP